jgi:serine/threonine protein kinase
MVELVGRRLGKYQILSEIGRGGMAAVYRAFDPDLQRYVALKVLSPRLAVEEQVLRRFEREATTAANLKHPNIVIIHDVGSAEGYYFLVMELLEGQTLREEIRTHGALPPARVTHITTQLASALDYAHQRDLVHRDVKPSNVILGAGDHATLTDFGLVLAAHSSRLTEAGTALGTLEYMPPEQLAGEEIDWRSDVYSLGVLVYESLTGQVPFSADTPYSMMRKVMYEPPPPLGSVIATLPASVERVVMQVLAKQPSERYRSAGEFAAALYRALAGGEIELVDSLGRTFSLRRGTTTVGRDPDNILFIDDQQVSRHHAEIQFDGTSWNLVDLGSTNGSFVNDQRLWPGQPRRLQPADVVRFGPNAVFQVTVHATPPSGSGDTQQGKRPTLPFASAGGTPREN